MKLFNREPAVVIGTIGSCVIAVAGVLLGNGFISEAVNGKLVDFTNAAVQIAVILTPLIVGIATRSQVTPVNK